MTICSIKGCFFSFSFLCGLKCVGLNKPILLAQQCRISSMCPSRVLYQGSVSWMAMHLRLPFLPKPWIWECGAGGGFAQSCMNFYSASAEQCFNYGLSVLIAPAHFPIRKKNLFSFLLHRYSLEPWSFCRNRYLPEKDKPQRVWIKFSFW